MTTPAPSTYQPGDVLLGKYRVERVLGIGGMGMVLAVRHLTLGELFAVKLMLPEMLSHPEAVGRFLREAQSSARLRGEHVARVHDVGTLETGIPYMVLEYLEGTDLDNMLVSRGALAVGEAAGYVYQVCEALVEAHGQGIVHRDLKPANFFLTHRANGTPCIKVLDFGISKDMGGADKITPKLTQTGAILGSPHYMSPEQLLDGKNVDTRCDIWALGIILYELVTGTTPFTGETMPEIVAKVLSTVPQPPSQVRAGITPAFDAVVIRCTEKNRDKRFQSIQEFMTALLPFVNENDTQLAGPIQVIPPKSAGQSNIAQSAVSWGHATVPSVPPHAGKPAGSSSGRILKIAAALGVLLILGIVAFMAIRPKDRDHDTHAGLPSSGPVGVKPAAPAPPALDAPATTTTATMATTAIASAAPAASTTSTSTAKTAPPISIRTPAVVLTTGKIKNKVKGFDE